ncbi:hypothetical protein LIER_35717 [Lithospermum erythrorhizon]|uniref:Uncharacterized protein n=1 Tax=Lithospermum erythrorhizon TaxID=34254 RepID=A0AAV3NVD9_LITER
MFILRTGSAMAVLRLYVDDILLTTSTNSLLDRVIGMLKAEFSMIDLGSFNFLWVFQRLLKVLDVCTCGVGFGVQVCPVVLCDNVSTTYMASNPANHARTKHIEIDIHFVRERVAQRRLKVSYVPRADQLADFFTKSLSSNRLQLLCSNLGIGVPPT